MLRKPIIRSNINTQKQISNIYMPDLVIKNALLFLNDTIQLAEIAVDDGKISKIGKIVGCQDVNEVIDAKGALVLPGVIDPHVHFRDPGMTKKEDWYTGSCAAAAGGVTTVIDHPNTIPPTIDSSSFKEKLKEAKKKIPDRLLYQCRSDGKSGPFERTVGVRRKVIW